MAGVMSLLLRSIPALAGKPVWSPGGYTPGRVYPRARGEAYPICSYLVAWAGLSPRSRGSQPSARSALLTGSIPALAGKPARTRGQGGVYPRARGEADAGIELSAGQTGLSPRSRGSPVAQKGDNTMSRSIPALAGKPKIDPRDCSFNAVYPRARGEAFAIETRKAPKRGLSPRSRGSHQGQAAARHAPRSIPALAGKPLLATCRISCKKVYPRARGEARMDELDAAWPGGLSPRSRGSPSRASQATRIRGSIPALAGKPLSGAPTMPGTEVYPRARGEATSRTRTGLSPVGLSPRSRGSPAAGGVADLPPGSIPALAGKPSG